MIVSVEIGSTVLRGACYDRYENGRPPLRTAEIPLPLRQADDEAFSQAIRSLLERLEPGKAPIAVAIPSEWCCFRTVSFPFRKTSRVEGTLAYALEGRLPGAIEQYVVEPVTEIIPVGEGGARVHAAACSTERLDRILEAFHRAGADPCILQPVAVSLAHRAAEIATHRAEGTPLVIRIDDGVCNLVWTMDGEPIVCQSVSVCRSGSSEPVSAAEFSERIRFAVRAQEVSDGAMECREVLLLASEDRREALADAVGIALDIPVMVLPDDGVWAGVAGAAGDASRRNQFAASFRRGAYEYPPYAARRDRRIGAALLLAAGIVLAFSLASLKNHLRAKRDILSSLNQQKLLAEEFGRSTPMSPHAMAALVKQLETEANLSGQASVRSCLRIWVDFMSQTEAYSDIVFESIDIKQGGIALKAVAPDDRQAWAFHRTMESSPTFRPDARFAPTQQPDGSVSFTMNLGYRP